MKTAIITGAGSGIGLATAVLLAEQGYRIVGVGRDEAKLANLTTKLGKGRGRRHRGDDRLPVLAGIRDGKRPVGRRRRRLDEYQISEPARDGIGVDGTPGRVTRSCPDRIMGARLASHDPTGLA